MIDSAPRDDDTERLRDEADAVIERYKSYLASPTFQHSLDVAVLTKIAGDDKADIRERRRAAEVLAKLRLKAMEGLADLVAAREQVMDRLGLKAGTPALALTQVNNRIEIVRASDWRSAAPLEQGEEIVAEVLPAGAHETNGHAVRHEEAHQEDDDDADDPAA